MDEIPVTVTERAASRLRDIMAAEHKPVSSLRIALVRTRCMGGRGFTYRLGLEDSPSKDDAVFDYNGLTVLIDPASSGYLHGAELDYVESPEGTGFMVNNPNVVAKCPCGHHDIFE
ncbi:MAG: iron-sulfur cluster assembly accessory protein [Candidatus Rokubacteria bacterium]|nr:iron-sulfur cluster assembly accessory protein [Candidatus Rokubacteria bacterium]